MGFKNAKVQPVEFLVDKYIQLVDGSQLRNYKVSMFFAVFDQCIDFS